MAAHWHIRFFGGLVLAGPERAVTHFRTQKTATLLAYLAYHRGRSFPREVLADMLWPGSTAAGRHSLSTALSSLRHELALPGVAADTVLVADRFCVSLNTEAVSTDVAEFKAAILGAKRASSPRDRIRALKQAVDLYRGEFLPGFYEDWIIEEQMAHSETFVKALCDLTLLLEKRGDNVAALEYARRATQADPLREEPYRELMRLYAAMGEPGAAMRQYQELVRIFRHELGEPPSPAIRALARKIEEQLAIGERAEPVTSGTTGQQEQARAGRSGPSRVAPLGTVTFLLAEASTSRTTRSDRPSTFEKVFRRETLGHGGHVGETGDRQLLGVFVRATDAVGCAAACQRSLARHGRGKGGRARPVPRAAIHSGDAEQKRNIYCGAAIEHTARLLAASHEGQILCSEATAGLLRLVPNGGLTIRSLGVYRIQDTRALEHLYQIDYPGMGEGEFPPPRGAYGHASNLPAQRPHFFGREEEIRNLEALLTSEDCRLVTLAGPPGVGKSRLALEVARRLIEFFRGAVWYAPLAGLDHASRIPDQILKAMGVKPDPNSDTLTQIALSLADDRALLVLDDMDLPADGASLVRGLLERCPRLVVLVTSREWLRLPGEREVAVSPLPIAGTEQTASALAGVPGVQLFVDRARALRPDFELTDDNAPAVAKICRRLEGLPLAIELAASRISTADVKATLGFFERYLDLPINGPAGSGESNRHSTLRAALDWSHGRLSPDSQRFFARLSVFRGGWTAEAAEAVCDEPLALDYLADLADCSLIASEHGPRTVRFRMLELVREYASERLEQLGEVAAVLDRHRGFYLDLAEKAAPELRKFQSCERLEVLDAEHENLLAAIHRCRVVPDCLPSALRLAVALRRFWHHRGYLGLGRSVLTELLSGMDVGERPQLWAEAQLAIGVLAREQGDHRTAQSCLEDSLAICKELEESRGAASALQELGVMFAAKSDWDRARERYSWALELAQAVGDQRLEAEIRGNLGLTFLYESRCDEAGGELEQALALLRALDEKRGMAVQLANVALARIRNGDCRGACRQLRECVELARHLGEPRVASEALGALAELETHVAARCTEAGAATERWTRAAQMLGASQVLWREVGAWVPLSAATPAPALDAVRAALGESVFGGALAAGRAMSFEEATSSALDELAQLPVGPDQGVVAAMVPRPSPTSAP